MKGAYTLRDISWPVVRIYCPTCHRFAQYSRAGLVERFHNMPGILSKLRPCHGKGSGAVPSCQLGYWDSMTAERRREALAKPFDLKIQAGERFVLMIDTLRPPSHTSAAEHFEDARILSASNSAAASSRPSTTSTAVT
jgi:hypothetical protein